MGIDPSTWSLTVLYCEAWGTSKLDHLVLSVELGTERIKHCERILSLDAKPGRQYARKCLLAKTTKGGTMWHIIQLLWTNSFDSSQWGLQLPDVRHQNWHQFGVTCDDALNLGCGVSAPKFAKLRILLILGVSFELSNYIAIKLPV